MALMKRHYWWSLLVMLFIGAIALYTYQNLTAEPTWTTTTVERGSVSEIVGISGFVEAEDAAKLSFPSTGIVTDVFVRKGDVVTAGQLLATLGSAQLVAERSAAAATLHDALAGRSELETGPTTETRAVTSATVAAANAALQQTIATEAEKVSNARRTLLSTGLSAVANDPEEVATPPIVSGNYLCTEAGTYTLALYRSNADSGYSYRLAGLETMTGLASTEQPAALGTCGLFIQFDADSNYGTSAWTVTIPNERSVNFTTLKNAYDLARTQETQNVQAARDALNLATNQATAANAAPRVESLIKANAAVQAAQSRIAAIDARIADASIAAPFAGTITDVSIVAGETANLTPVITLLGETAFSLTARLPEIDITKVETGHTADVRFDARTSETYAGVVAFISPLPTTIDGVAYFDATIELSETPSWIRAGLNADVDITLRTETDVLRIPERYLMRTPDGVTVHKLIGREITPIKVTVDFIGNDGFAVITGLTAGDTIVAPEK